MSGYVTEVKEIHMRDTYKAVSDPARFGDHHFRISPIEHSFAEVAEIASRVPGTHIAYQQASFDTFAESIGQTVQCSFQGALPSHRS
jgi:hypothetical protein